MFNPIELCTKESNKEEETQGEGWTRTRRFTNRNTHWPRWAYILSLWTGKVSFNLHMCLGKENEHIYKWITCAFYNFTYTFFMNNIWWYLCDVLKIFFFFFPHRFHMERWLAVITIFVQLSGFTFHALGSLTSPKESGFVRSVVVTSRLSWSQEHNFWKNSKSTIKRRRRSLEQDTLLSPCCI